MVMNPMVESLKHHLKKTRTQDDIESIHHCYLWISLGNHSQHLPTPSTMVQKPEFIVSEPHWHCCYCQRHKVPHSEKTVNSLFKTLNRKEVYGIRPICAMVKSRYIGDGHPTFNRESLQWVYKPLLLG